MEEAFNVEDANVDMRCIKPSGEGTVVGGVRVRPRMRPWARVTMDALSCNAWPFGVSVVSVEDVAGTVGVVGVAGKAGTSAAVVDAAAAVFPKLDKCSWDSVTEETAWYCSMRRWPVGVMVLLHLALGGGVSDKAESNRSNQRWSGLAGASSFLVSPSLPFVACS